MTQHSELFSPSKAARRLGCPGSARLEAGLPEAPSPYAEEGSAAHFLAERCLNMDCPASKYQGRRIVRITGGFSLLQPGAKRNDGWEVTLEMAEAVQAYLDYTRGHQPAGGTRLIEQRLKVTEECFGTADHIYAVPFGPLYVDDYKHGVGVPVSPEENPQAMIYGLGAVYASPYDHSVVRISIIQPRSREPYSDPIPWLGELRAGAAGWEISVADLYAWRDKILLPGIAQCKDPSAPLAAGSWCRFCKAQGCCPEVNKEVTTMMQIHAPAGLPIPGVLSNDQIGAILDKTAMARAWLDEVEALAARKVEAGETIPGCAGNYKMVEGRSIREWADDGAAETFLESALADRAYERKLLSPAKAEAAFKACALDVKQLTPLITKKPGKPTLAAGNDKRPALASSAQRAFAHIQAAGVPDIG